VWFGNDDYSSTADMTGGTLPAMAWKEVMAYAHQNLEIRPLPGVSGASNLSIAARITSGVQAGLAEASAGASSGNLSRRSFEAISGIGSLLGGIERPAPSVTGSVAEQRAAVQTTGGVARAAGGRVAVP
jgi:penicillin-binding protein 1A